MKKTDEPIIVEQTYNCLKEKVWEALTNVDQMCQWFFDNIPAFKPEVGFEVQFNVKSEKREFLHVWKIIEVIPNKKIVYNWKYKNITGDSNVSFELFELNNHTTLKLTTEILKDFDTDIPEFKRESCVAGWTYFIQGNLRKYLENK